MDGRSNESPLLTRRGKVPGPERDPFLSVPDDVLRMTLESGLPLRTSRNPHLPNGLQDLSRVPSLLSEWGRRRETRREEWVQVDPG